MIRINKRVFLSVFFFKYICIYALLYFYFTIIYLEDYASKNNHLTLSRTIINASTIRGWYFIEYPFDRLSYRRRVKNRLVAMWDSYDGIFIRESDGWTG